MRIKNENGFTLVEILTVLAIIGILAAIATPNFLSWLPDMRLKAAARDLYSNMQKARMIAVKSNRNTAIIFAAVQGRYSICDDWNSTTSSCDGASQTIDFSSMKSEIGYGPGSATSPVGSTFDDDNVTYNLPLPANVATFNSQGIGKNGYVYLDHQDGTTTYAVGSSTSGVIRLLKWKGSNWE